jgi:hypothetical protein
VPPTTRCIVSSDRLDDLTLSQPCGVPASVALSSALLLCLLCAGCDRAADAHELVGAANDAGVANAASTLDAASSAPAIVWHSASAPLEPEGHTALLSLELPPGTRALSVRSSLADPALSSRTCFQLEDVTVDEQSWVGPTATEDFGDYCTTCRERVSVGAGYGFHVLPSGADDDLELSALQLRVALRDCTTLTPLSAAAAGADRVVVEHAVWLPPSPDHKLSLPVSIVIASEHAFEADATLLPSALARLQSIWSAAGIALSFVAQPAIAASSMPIGYSASDRTQLVSLTRAAHSALAALQVERAWPVFVMTTCLQRTDLLSGARTEPLAVTPHLPGGFGVNDEPDLILIAAERCEGLEPGPRFLDPETLAAVMAHELGHYLGLYHVQESDGRQDTLSDTSPERANLMQAMPSPDAITLSQAQMRVARRHPVFVLTDLTPQP